MVDPSTTTLTMIRKWFFTLEGTNKVTQNNPQVGGTWEIIDHREGQDYRAIGKYLEIHPPKKLLVKCMIALNMAGIICLSD